MAINGMPQADGVGMWAMDTGVVQGKLVKAQTKDDQLCLIFREGGHTYSAELAKSDSGYSGTYEIDNEKPRTRKPEISCRIYSDGSDRVLVGTWWERNKKYHWWATWRE